jgi:hypothetical protein
VTPSVPAPRGGRVVARYDVKEQLAEGGMGVVYRVIDRSTGEARALKRLNADAATQPFMVESFEREYQVLASLDHPRIIKVFDYGIDEAGPYYTMELVEGRDMRDAAPVSYREACLYLRDVATSLALLHARRLIHRDLSPTNVRMTPDGHCKLLDFGALVAFGPCRHVVGTAPAIPPEALGNAPLDQRADLYALGALSYWMLTRRHAYPARRIEELPELWGEPPPPPSALVPGIPKELDGLVLSLLSADALARPGSAAEVIARLNVIGHLTPEDEGDAERLAQSFLLSPRFTGRNMELTTLRARTEAAVAGNGSALRIRAVPGMGRTRLLEELRTRAQLAGAAAVCVDASMHRQLHGTARALVLRLLEMAPELARGRFVKYRAPLAALGRDVEARLPSGASIPPPSPTGETPQETPGTLEDWFLEASAAKPLVLEVDNVEYADAGSLGLLAQLAKLSGQHALLVVVSERIHRDERENKGLFALRHHTTPLELHGLTSGETLELVQSLFGDPPNVERFAEWLHGRTAGSPFYTLEACRRLVAKEVVRYLNGFWVLPVERPDAELPAALEDALSTRLSALGEEARALAECLSLSREQPTVELCRLIAETDERRALQLLDELARNDVLYADREGFRFSSAGLREALLSGMAADRREVNHRRLGEAFAFLATRDNPALRIEAGFHLIRGGDEVRGADLIARVTHDSVAVRTLIANLYHAGRPVQAALEVYKRHRRSPYERMPLLAALAHCSYYEDRSWGERYGDEALDVLENLSGLATARRLRPFFGRYLALVFGILFAFVRFRLTPRKERGYPFSEIFVQLFGAVTTLTGIASSALDGERAARVADVLEPFAVLPERTTPVGIYQFCRSLQEIAREHQASAFVVFETLIRRFENPRYYPTLPQDARKLYIAGGHYARGAFAVMRADPRPALESAAALDASGMKLYQMIASQLRFLHHMYRGELAKALPHREQVELHAAHVGSAWQVEIWEAPALIPVNALLHDIVGITRIADRLEVQSQTIRSLRLYAFLARRALFLVRNEAEELRRIAEDAELDRLPPRSYIGWGATQGLYARGNNDVGNHGRAKALCEAALAHMTDDDLEYVAMFLLVEIELAVADAALGETGLALARIDRLLARFENTDHPLALGLLHEARARIAWAAGRTDEYKQGLAHVEHWFRYSGTPALVAKCERLAELDSGTTGTRRAQGGLLPPTLPPEQSSPRSTHAKSDRDLRDVQTVNNVPRRAGS